jgi:hypothetical protein
VKLKNDCYDVQRSSRLFGLGVPPANSLAGVGPFRGSLFAPYRPWRHQALQAPHAFALRALSHRSNAHPNTLQKEKVLLMKSTFEELPARMDLRENPPVVSFPEKTFILQY